VTPNTYRRRGVAARRSRGSGGAEGARRRGCGSKQEVTRASTWPGLGGALRHGEVEAHRGSFAAAR
jgi:hypothetical protein